MSVDFMFFNVVFPDAATFVKARNVSRPNAVFKKTLPSIIFSFY